MKTIVVATLRWAPRKREPKQRSKADVRRGRIIATATGDKVGPSPP